MKHHIFIYLLFTSVIHFSCSSTAKLSSDRLEQEQKIRHFAESKSFVFNATTVNPMRANILNIIPNGNQLRNLAPGYTLRVMNDSVSAYLPYYGRAYTAPESFSTDNGIKVNTKNFSYSFKQNKTGVYTIKINLNNDKTTSYFILELAQSGYATLQVQSINRESISFYGNVTSLKQDIQ